MIEFTVWDKIANVFLQQHKDITYVPIEIEHSIKHTIIYSFIEHLIEFRSSLHTFFYVDSKQCFSYIDTLQENNLGFIA